MQQAVRDYDRAWERNDYAQVCARSTEARRREWARITAQPDCEAGLRALARMREEYEHPPADSEVVAVIELRGEELPTTRWEIKGDFAVGYTRLGAAERLRKVGGRWLVDAAPG